jgi:hypothetical protein
MNYSSLHVKQLISPWSLAVHYYYYYYYQTLLYFFEDEI